MTKEKGPTCLKVAKLKLIGMTVSNGKLIPKVTAKIGKPSPPPPPPPPPA